MKIMALGCAILFIVSTAIAADTSGQFKKVDIKITSKPQLRIIDWTPILSNKQFQMIQDCQ